jgi:hypothetical protein
MLLFLPVVSSSRHRLLFNRFYGMLDTVWGGGGMVDTEDLKSFGRKPVRVRLPPALPSIASLSQNIAKHHASLINSSSLSGKVHDLRNGIASRLASRGSRRSRRASPTIFRLKRTRTIASAGPSIIQGSLKIKLCASVIIDPHSGVGG